MAIQYQILSNLLFEVWDKVMLLIVAIRGCLKSLSVAVLVMLWWIKQYAN
jgi:hypothetical protein